MQEVVVMVSSCGGSSSGGIGIPNNNGRDSDTQVLVKEIIEEYGFTAN